MSLLVCSYGIGCCALIVSAIGCPFASKLLKAVTRDDDESAVGGL